MAQIGIHHKDPARCRGRGAGQHRASQSTGRALALDQANWLALPVKKDSFAGSVSRSIVDDQNFDREGSGALLKDSVQEWLDVVRFIERGNYDAELFRFQSARAV
jgi:hypothetical protein